VMSDNVIEVHNLTKRYGQTTVVKGISFSVRTQPLGQDRSECMDGYHSKPANISGTACYHFATQFGSTRQNHAGRGDIAASNCADNSVLRDTGWYRTIRG